MTSPQHEFESVFSVRADALGEPGQRHFRLLVEAPQGSATLWMEKSNLYGLAVSIRQLLATVPSEEAPPSSPPTEDTPPIGDVTVEFQVESLALGYDPDDDRFSLIAHEDAEEEDPEEATFRCWVSRQQIEALAEEAFEVCAAGRPPCPLCHGPMDPKGHICPKHNGYRLD